MNHRPKTVLLFDDDKTYLMTILRQAKAMQVEAIACDTMDEFCLRALEGNYDVALIDYHLEHFKGDVVAKVVENKPVVLMSMDSSASNEKSQWPQSISGFVSKSGTPKEVILAALNFVTQGAPQ